VIITNLFIAAHIVAFVGWLLLIVGVLRRRRLSHAARWAGLGLAIGYCVLFVANAGEASFLIRDYSVSGVQRFFANPDLALVGWIHYLAFDLWIGAWEVDEAPETMPRPLLVATLLLTCAVGPIGLCAFLLARRLR
jgi:hypothetical protein